MMSFPLQVWFQNRRAKWRRQEKLESNSLKINENYPISILGPRHSSGLSSNLPLDPWMTPPIANACAVPSSLITSSSIPAYSALFPVPAMSSPIANLAPTIATYNGIFSGVNTFGDPDSRSTSIVSLRMKAREHLEILDNKSSASVI